MKACGSDRPIPAPTRRSVWRGPLIVLLILLSATISFGGFQSKTASGLPDPGPNIAVASGPSSSWFHSLAVDATGRLYLAWIDNRSGSRGVYTADSADGSIWSTPTRVDAPGAESFAASLAVEREPAGFEGRLYLAFQRGKEIWFTWSNDAVAWAVPRRLDLAPVRASATSPTVAASGGRVFVAWADWRNPDESHILMRVSPDGGASWGPEVQVSPPGSSNVEPAVDAKGDDVVVVWSRPSPLRSIWSARSENGGDTWRDSVVANASNLSDTVENPALCVDEVGTAHVAWVGSTIAGTGRVYYSSSGDGVSWTSPAVVNDNLLSMRPARPSIAAFAGTLWIAWDDSPKGHGNVYASWSTDGYSWGANPFDGSDLRVDDTERNSDPADDRSVQQRPVVRTGGWGVYVAWEDYRAGTADIYFSEIKTSPLVITEIQDEPASDSRVEVYNAARTPFDMTGVMLLSGTSRVDLSPVGAIAARGYIVIGAPTSSDLQAVIDLGTEGASVALVRGGGTLASAGFGIRGVAPDPLPGQSAARYAGSLDYAMAWDRAGTPSFGARNAVVRPNPRSELVLNEIVEHAASPQDRFVELFYSGSGPLDLTGFSLVADEVFVFTGGTVGPAARYSLVQPDRAPTLFTSLQDGGDNVYLYDPAGRRLDMIGWSSPVPIGYSWARLKDGAGGRTAYNDVTADREGWGRGGAPSPELLEVGPEAIIDSDIGSTVRFDMIATYRALVGDYVNLRVIDAPSDWTTSLRWPDGTLLQDSPVDADDTPDLGFLARDARAAFVLQSALPLDTAVETEATMTLEARAASAGGPEDTVALTIRLRPHLNVSREVMPGTVYVRGSGPPYNEIARITLSLRGAGVPATTPMPQDVVLQIDYSGSMNGNDPTNLRVEAVKGYIDDMRDEDRGSIIGFTSYAWVVSDRPLTNATASGKVLLKADADTLACSPNCRPESYTNIDSALALGNSWLRTYGNRSRPWFEILLTDGNCSPDPCEATGSLVGQARMDGITIFTVGLGSTVNETYLRGIASPTGGQYFHANTASDIVRIYDGIRERIIRTAAADPDVRDALPMVQDVLAPYLTVIPGSFVDPYAGSPRPPDYFARLPDRTVLQWNVSRIDLDERWGVRYSVNASRVGTVDVAVYPGARVRSLRWDGVTVVQPIPQGRLEVLDREPTPPTITKTLPMYGASGVAVDATVRVRFSEAMDAPSVQWTLKPTTSAVASWIAPDEVLIDHTAFEPCTVYTVHILSGRDREGEALVAGPTPNPFSFTTTCPLRVGYTITRFPAIGYVWVDEKTYRAPAFFIWTSGDVHRIAVSELDPVGGSRLAFRDWNDGGPPDHEVTVGVTDGFLSATFSLQHPAQLTLVGLPVDRPASVAYWFSGARHTISSHDIWSSWVDDASVLSVDDTVTGGLGERFATGDASRWTVSGPFEAWVAYVHQYQAAVHLAGLEGGAALLRFTAWGQGSQFPVTSTWGSWVDAGSQVSVEDTVVVSMRDRFRTRDPASWEVVSAIDVAVAYVHQFRPHVILEGTDEGHAVGARWQAEGALKSSPRNVGEWSDWADRGTTLEIDPETTGVPPRRANDPTTFTVETPLDATIRYVDPEGGPVPPNWKPLLALVYVATMLVSGFALRRIPRRSATAPRNRVVGKTSSSPPESDVHRFRNPRLRFLAIASPFVAVEAILGALSHFTGVLRIPDGGSWFPLGVWVNTGVLLAGLITASEIWRGWFRTAGRRSVPGGRGSAPPGGARVFSGETSGEEPFNNDLRIVRR